MLEATVKATAISARLRPSYVTDFMSPPIHNSSSLNPHDMRPSYSVRHIAIMSVQMLYETRMIIELNQHRAVTFLDNGI